MKSLTRRLLLGGSVALAGLWLRCGNNVLPPPPPETHTVYPFRAFAMTLRPLSIQRPSDVGGSPNPGIAAYNLTAFFCGGKQTATFQWQVPAAVGTIAPKSGSLSLSDATVYLRPADRPPLGLYTFRAAGKCGLESSTVAVNFAVVENTWMKHKRITFANLLNEPEDLVQSPVWMADGDLDAKDDSILYVEFPSAQAVKLRRIAAYRGMNLAEQVTSDVNLPPEGDGFNFETAQTLTPDPAPFGLGRHEILFSATYDLRYPDRCRNPTACSAYIPQSLWEVTSPVGASVRAPQVLTFDSTYVSGGVTPFFAYDFKMPRWDPSTPPGSSLARIAFLSNMGPGGGAGAGALDLWLADLQFRSFPHPDTLVNYRRVTTHVGISSFDWDRDGQTIYFTGGPKGLGRVDVASGAIEPIVLPDTLRLACLPDHNNAAELGGFASVSVFHRPGEGRLIAFQATQENLVNLYVFDEQAFTLTRLLPVAVPVTTNLFPRWHPFAKVLVYVSDYSVAAWTDDDKPPPNNPDIYGQRRTLYPSMWALSLEDQP